VSDGAQTGTSNKNSSDVSKTFRVVYQDWKILGSSIVCEEKEFVGVLKSVLNSNVVERGEEEFRFPEKEGGAMLRSSRALRGFLGVIASVSASSLAFASPSIFTNANEMGAIAVVSSAACKVKFLCVLLLGL